MEANITSKDVDIAVVDDALNQHGKSSTADSGERVPSVFITTPVVSLPDGIHCPVMSLLKK